jgi:hypothetical protein
MYISLTICEQIGSVIGETKFRNSKNISHKIEHAIREEDN